MQTQTATVAMSTSERPVTQRDVVRLALVGERRAASSPRSVRLVRLVEPRGMRAGGGALARVVDGKACFPAAYATMQQHLGRDLDSFVWVKWMRADPRVNGQPDGAYSQARFVLASRRL